MTAALLVFEGPGHMARPELARLLQAFPLVQFREVDATHYEVSASEEALCALRAQPFWAVWPRLR